MPAGRQVAEIKSRDPKARDRERQRAEQEIKKRLSRR